MKKISCLLFALTMAFAFLQPIKAFLLPSKEVIMKHGEDMYTGLARLEQLMLAANRPGGTGKRPEQI